jgi:drug/metabolite transporter (DMT)-like permease
MAMNQLYQLPYQKEVTSRIFMVDKRVLAWLAIVITTIVWASSLVLGKLVFDVYQDMTPILFVALRYTIACPFLILLAGTRRSSLTNRTAVRKAWPAILIAGISGPFFSQILQYIGLDLSVASDTLLLLNMSPVFAVLLAAPLLNEHITREKVLGLILATIGATLIVLATTSAESVNIANRVLGDVIVIISTFLFAVNGIAGKVAVGTVDAISVTLYSTMVSVPLLWICAFLFEDISLLLTTSLLTWGIMLWIAIVNTAIAFVLYYESMRYIEASKVQIALNLIAVWGVIMAFLLLNEAIVVLQIVGGILTVAGVALTYSKQRKSVEPKD